VEEDTYTPAEAAKILRLSKRRVTQMLNSGELEGKQDQNGRWQIPQWAVHEQLEERRAETGSPSRVRGSPTEDAEHQRSQQDLMRELGRLEGRLELTEKAQSTVEDERDRLIAHLEDERAERRRLQLELEAALERERLHHVSWWRRLFGR
jgi:excisionase family DNA binding protein